MENEHDLLFFKSSLHAYEYAYSQAPSIHDLSEGDTVSAIVLNSRQGSGDVQITTLLAAITDGNAYFTENVIPIGWDFTALPAELQKLATTAGRIIYEAPCVDGTPRLEIGSLVLVRIGWILPGESVHNIGAVVAGDVEPIISNKGRWKIKRVE